MDFHKLLDDLTPATRAKLSAAIDNLAEDEMDTAELCALYHLCAAVEQAQRRGRGDKYIPRDVDR